LQDIFTAATAAHLSRARERFRFEGEPITVTPRVALTLALVVHELVTNAAKYGALSEPEGRIDIRWHLQGGASPILRIEWRERDGPPTRVPERRGFGTRFIEGSVASELRGSAKLDFDPAGLCCKMEIPLDVAAPEASGYSV
jgi:two-component sensor histidine kinase